MRKKEHHPRKTTSDNLEIGQYGALKLSGSMPTEASIWHSIQSKDISQNIREYMWKCLHGTHKLGKYWNKTPNHEE
ncbi:hypothetical protein C8J56DRAFT_774631 [Mycena floridula]|nr:hypothetical protein C8J56DRAFT_774631 [Mycena floridula]